MHKRFGEYLVLIDVITIRQLQNTLDIQVQYEHDGTGHIVLGELLVEMNYISKYDIDIYYEEYKNAISKGK